jgi:hypothetical protein
VDSIQARMSCTSLNNFFAPGTAGAKNAESVVLTAVTSEGLDDPNASWAAATPSGQLTMYISNPGAWDFFKGGKNYRITITEDEG